MINDFYYKTVDILQKSINATEIRFIIHGFRTDKGLLIDKDGDISISVDKSLYKSIIEKYQFGSKIELLF